MLRVIAAGSAAYAQAVVDAGGVVCFVAALRAHPSDRAVQASSCNVLASTLQLDACTALSLGCARSAATKHTTPPASTTACAYAALPAAMTRSTLQLDACTSRSNGSFESW